MIIKYGDFPTLAEIRHDYDELIAMVGAPFSVAAVELLQTLRPSLFLEINGTWADDYIKQGGTDAGIEWVRVESFGCLDFIYFWRDGCILFDVWSNGIYDDFIRDTTIDKLTATAYEKARADALGIDTPAEEAPAEEAPKGFYFELAGGRYFIPAESLEDFRIKEA